MASVARNPNAVNFSGVAWTGAENLTGAPDQVGALVVALLTVDSYAQLTDYGLTSTDIPEGSRIDGIEIGVTLRETGPPVGFTVHANLLNQREPYGVEKTVADDTFNGDFHEIVLGGPADTFGVELDTEYIYSLLEVAVGVSDEKGNEPEVEVDAVEVTVYFTEPNDFEDAVQNRKSISLKRRVRTAGTI